MPSIPALPGSEPDGRAVSVPPPADHAARSEAARAEASKPAEAEKAVERRPAVVQPDVQLRFQVNEETREITVLVLDKASKEVLRTIPPEEIRKFRSGDLFELFA